MLNLYCLCCSNNLLTYIQKRKKKICINTHTANVLIERRLFPSEKKKKKVKKEMAPFSQILGGQTSVVLPSLIYP